MKKSKMLVDLVSVHTDNGTLNLLHRGSGIVKAFQDIQVNAGIPGVDQRIEIIPFRQAYRSAVANFLQDRVS